MGCVAKICSVSWTACQLLCLQATDGGCTNLDGFVRIHGAGRLSLPSLGRQPLLLLLHPQLLVVLFAQEPPPRGHDRFEQPFVAVGEFAPLAGASGERMLAPAVRRGDVRARVSAPGWMGEVGEDVGGDVPPEGGGVRVAAVAGGGVDGVGGGGVDPARLVDEAAHGGVVAPPPPLYGPRATGVEPFGAARYEDAEVEAVAGGGGGAGDDVRPGGGERRREAEGARERGSMLGAAAQSDSQEHAGNMIEYKSMSVASPPRPSAITQPHATSIDTYREYVA